MKLAVADTTPLHYWILIGQIEVLGRLFERVLAPPAVLQELQHPHAPPAEASWAARLPTWVEIRRPLSEIQARLGRGEVQAISLALELSDAILLVDDLKARREAERRGILAVGTLALMDLADERGLLSFEDSVVNLLSTSFHVEKNLVESVLEKVRIRKSGPA